MRARSRADDAEPRHRRARLRRRLGEVAPTRPARRAARLERQGDPAAARRGGGGARPPQRAHRRASEPRPRRARLRDDPRPLRASRTAASPTRASSASSSERARSSPTSAEEHRDVRITFGDTQVQPRRVLASPEWSGMESRERRYSPFTINIERSRAVPDAHGPPAVLRRPRVDARHGRGPAHLPPAGRRRRHGRRPGLRRPRPEGGAPPLAVPALEMVDPLRVPGQPAHADAVPRRPGRLDRRRGRREDRRHRQRLGRGLQPQRRHHRARRRLAPCARGRRR